MFLAWLHPYFRVSCYSIDGFAGVFSDCLRAPVPLLASYFETAAAYHRADCPKYLEKSFPWAAWGGTAAAGSTCDKIVCVRIELFHIGTFGDDRCNFCGGRAFGGVCFQRIYCHKAFGCVEKFNSGIRCDGDLVFVHALSGKMGDKRDRFFWGIIGNLHFISVVAALFLRFCVQKNQLLVGRRAAAFYIQHG